MMISINKSLLISACAVLTAFPAVADLVVASLNPVMADLARQVGGENVTVVDLMKPGMNPHTFSPSPEDMRKADKADIVLVAGKGLEKFLDDIRGNLSSDQEIFEVGRRIPSILINAEDTIFACCPGHVGGSLDPHWWLSIENMQRAGRLLGAEFAKLDPENQEAYRANAREYALRLDDLQVWAKNEISRIPRNERILATAHLAYAYFCREFGFKSLPVGSHGTDPGYLGKVVDSLKSNQVKVVFPERSTKPSTLEAMVRDTDVTVGGYLLADTPDPKEPTYEAMMRHNINTIMAAFEGE